MGLETSRSKEIEADSNPLGLIKHFNNGRKAKKGDWR
jgi:hypothetical protein